MTALYDQAAELRTMMGATRSRATANVIAITSEKLADGEGPRDVARAALGAGVERDGGDEGGAAPPVSGATGPGVDDAVSYAAGAPGWAGQQDAELVDVRPGRHSVAEALKQRYVDELDSRGVEEDELVGDPAVALLFEQVEGEGQDWFGRFPA